MHSYAYGVDIRVANWRTRPKVPIVNREESFEFSKIIVGFLRHHNASGPLKMRINELGYAYVSEILGYVNYHRGRVRRRLMPLGRLRPWWCCHRETF